MGKKRRHSDSDSSSSSSSSSDSDADRKRKKHKKEKHKKEKHKTEKKPKNKSKDKEKDLLKAAKAFLESKLGVPPGPSGSGPTAPSSRGAQTQDVDVERVLKHCAEAGKANTRQEVLEAITDSDYFARNSEFSAWLLQEGGGIYFNQLSSETARELFAGFVELWNAGRLPQKYYSGLVQQSRRTNHNWAIKGGGVAASGPGGMRAFMADQQERQGAAHAAERAHVRSAARDLLAEVAPKLEGRDKMIEEKRARRELARGGADDDAFGGFVPGGGRGDDLLGGGDSLAAAKAREAKRQEVQRQRAMVKQEDVAVRAAAYAAKEDEKMAAFRALLAQGPITIAKRQ